MWHPKSCCFNLSKSSSMYTLNKMGDNTPPCLTPLETETLVDITPFHDALRFWRVYKSMIMRRKTPGIFLSINKENNLTKIHLSFDRLHYHVQIYDLTLTWCTSPEFGMYKVHYVAPRPSYSWLENYLILCFEYFPMKKMYSNLPQVIPHCSCCPVTKFLDS